MRFAVLGTDPDILALVAAAKSLGHEIAWLGDVRPADAARLASLVPSLPVPSADWEMLLDQATVDAVLVGRGLATAELRAEQLKRLATDAVPMLVVHPICDSVLTYYEVDMIRRETRGLVQHYNPFADHPIVDTLANWVSAPASAESDALQRRDALPQITPIHQVSCERYAADTGRDATLGHLARDAELIVAITGPIRRVSAVGPQPTAASYASLQVQLAAFGPQSIRWSVTPHSARSQGANLTFVGERGVATLHANEASVDAGATPWTMEEVRDAERQETSLPTFDAPAAAIERLALALAETDHELRAKRSTWEKATQSMEVVDAIELSLQKGRTIEVHQQQLTEQLAFRGTMAAMGCGLLLVGFAVIVFATLMGGIETMVDKKLIPSWPIVLLAVLAFFLLLQAVPLLIPKRKRDRMRDDKDSASS